MFKFFRKRKLTKIEFYKYIIRASEYVNKYYTTSVQPQETNLDKPTKTSTNPSPEEICEKSPVPHVNTDSDVRYSLKTDQENDIRYSERDNDNCPNNRESDTLPSENDKDSTPTRTIRYSRGTASTDDNYNVLEVYHALKKLKSGINKNNSLIMSILEENINQTFSERLLDHIREKGVRDSEVYKAAQIDKRLFSKIASNRKYKPSKDTVIALALALELSVFQALDLLDRAGYTLSHSDKRDVIIEFFFREKIYNLIDANEILYNLDQKPIGRF